MIAAALHLINSARSLSAKSWLVAIALVAIVAAAARLVTYGEHREAVRIATIAWADTIRGDLATLRVAQTEHRTALAQLTLARPATIATGVARANARSAVVIPAAIPSAQAVMPGARHGSRDDNGATRVGTSNSCRDGCGTREGELSECGALLSLCDTQRSEITPDCICPGDGGDTHRFAMFAVCHQPRRRGHNGDEGDGNEP